MKIAFEWQCLFRWFRFISMLFARTILVSFVVAVLALGCLFAASYYVFQGNATVLSHLREAYSNKRLIIKQDYGALSDYDARGIEYIYRFDCLVWGMLITPYKNGWEQVIRNHRFNDASNMTQDEMLAHTPACQPLAAFLNPAQRHLSYTLSYYDRYILGHKLVAALLLQHMDPWEMSKFMFIISYGLLALLLILIPIRKLPPEKARPLVAWVVVFSLFYGLSHFSKTIYFAPMDWGHFLFLAAYFYLPRTNDFNEKTFPLLAAAYGGWIAIFEFLTGGIPLGAALIALIASLEKWDRKTYIKIVFLALVAFVATAIFCFVIKVGLVAMLKDQDVFGLTTRALIHRMDGGIYNEHAEGYLEPFERHGFSRDFILGTFLGNVLFAIYEYADWCRVIGQGSGLFGKAIVLFSMGVLLYSALKSRKTAGSDNRIFACWLAISLIFMWFLLFWNHTLVHPFFMGRLLVIFPLTAAFCLVSPRTKIDLKGVLTN